jgi:hypothetical protein
MVILSFQREIFPKERPCFAKLLFLDAGFSKMLSRVAAHPAGTDRAIL